MGIRVLGGNSSLTTFGVAAQLRESSDSAAKALALAEKSDKTLYSIERQLYAIGQPTLHVRFSVPCSLKKFKDFCVALHTQSSKIKADYWEVPGGQWQHWPEDVKIRGQLDIYKNETNVVTYSFAGARITDDRSLVALPGSDDAEIHLDTKLRVPLNKGFKSLLDFSGTTAELNLPQPLSDLNLTACVIETQDGEVIELDTKGLKINYGLLYLN